ncbi:hypothetical protein KM043_016745 [Ampulex compressa]|nr:hypothetical protein KM043_016745 [Ampulex compressa]
MTLWHVDERSTFGEKYRKLCTLPPTHINPSLLVNGQRDLNICDTRLEESPVEAVTHNNFGEEEIPSKRFHSVSQLLRWICTYPRSTNKSQSIIRELPRTHADSDAHDQAGPCYHMERSRRESIGICQEAQSDWWWLEHVFKQRKAIAIKSPQLYALQKVSSIKERNLSRQALL